MQNGTQYNCPLTGRSINCQLLQTPNSHYIVVAELLCKSILTTFQKQKTKTKTKNQQFFICLFVCLFFLNEDDFNIFNINYLCEVYPKLIRWEWLLHYVDIYIYILGNFLFDADHNTTFSLLTYLRLTQFPYSETSNFPDDFKPLNEIGNFDTLK